MIFIFISYSYVVNLDHLGVIVGERQKVLATRCVMVRCRMFWKWWGPPRGTNLGRHVGFLVFLIPFVSSYLLSSITSSLHKNYIECCLKNASLWSIRDLGEWVLLARSREGSMSRPWWRFLHKMKMVFTSLGPRDFSTRTWYPREKMDGRQEVGVPAVYPREGGF